MAVTTVTAVTAVTAVTCDGCDRDQREARDADVAHRHLPAMVAGPGGYSLIAGFCYWCGTLLST